MLASQLLAKKRDGHPLQEDEIWFLIRGFCSGDVADYQMSALAMAICIRGMNSRETATLTQAMLESGDRLPRDGAADRIRVDKHSTGGLGDKVSLVLAPLLAACDLDVPMISGRGLGLTGGTLDKLESIDGFETQLSTEQASAILRDTGLFIIGASDEIAPADRQLYALRDVTGTVESIPLITASILSKKLAANLDALVMDVKTGSAAFMKTETQAKDLAESLVEVGSHAGLSTTAIVSDMDQPLGETIGNAIEVNEALKVLQGGPGVVRDLTLELGAALLTQINAAQSLEPARARLAGFIDGGQAMDKFQRMIHSQGGRLADRCKLAPPHVVTANLDGFLKRYDCRILGETVVAMGGGRRKAGDPIDHSVGLQIHRRIGERVVKGQPIITLHSHKQDAGNYLGGLEHAFEISDTRVEPRPLILHRLGIG